ncbi:hypothetical protein DFJ64_1628 [Thermasporomyces composti]|uniref:Uncharacterized protein n=2 Tax=Thermasporomyces composti TaxID=696763 RepID=A0A3D9V4D0_THECX|nr:hypothetical protein DFJ64_1628 [Thermasporomyces composti]
MKSALSDLEHKRMDMALLHLGVAIEHLAKAYLASISLSLVVDPKHVTSLFYAVGVNRKKYAELVLTISMKDALKRVAMLLETFPFRKPEDDLKDLIHTRNGIAHAAMWNPRYGEKAFILGLQTAEHLVLAIGKDAATFWGQYRAKVSVMMRDRRLAIKDIAAVRIEAAKREFESRFGSDVDEDLLRKIEGVPAGLSTDDAAPVTCPACGRLGYVQGDSELEGEPDWDIADGEPYFNGVYVFWELRVNSFACQVCKLELPTRELVEEAGIPTEIELRPATKEEEGDYYLDY